MRAFLSGIVVIWQREILRYSRDRVRIATSFFQPLMFLLVFGGGLRHAMSAQNFGVDFMQFMYPGIIAMNIMGIAIFSTVSTVWDREFGFLKEILAAPVPRASVALGKACGAATIATGQASVLLLLAPVLGVHFGLVALVELLAFMVLLAFTVAGLGLVVASRMKSMESFGIVMQVLVFPMFFLSGAFFPLNNVPAWMKVVSRLDPLTYGVDAFRQILLRGELSAEVSKIMVLHSLRVDALVLIALSALLLTLSVRAFQRQG